jgi:hypothetical protein
MNCFMYLGEFVGRVLAASEKYQIMTGALAMDGPRTELVRLAPDQILGASTGVEKKDRISVKIPRLHPSGV